MTPFDTFISQSPNNFIRIERGRVFHKTGSSNQYRNRRRYWCGTGKYWYFLRKYRSIRPLPRQSGKQSSFFWDLGPFGYFLISSNRRLSAHTATASGTGLTSQTVQQYLFSGLYANSLSFSCLVWMLSFDCFSETAYFWNLLLVQVASYFFLWYWVQKPQLYFNFKQLQTFVIQIIWDQLITKQPYRRRWPQ